jgi:hypothetical protein
MTMYDDEELRDAGWGEREIREYRRGYDSALSRIPASAYGTAEQIRAGAPRWIPGEPGAFSGNSTRAQWQRGTVAGRLSLMFPQPDEARELADAKELADRHEFAYGRRPDLQECLAAVRHNGPRGMDLRGEAAEIGMHFRAVGLPYAVVHQIDQPESGGVVFAPGRTPEEFGSGLTSPAR